MYEKMHTAITSHLQHHRLVFWYDPGGKHRQVMETLQSDATVLEVKNNEWWIKYHVMHQHNDRRFLIYAPYARPADRYNWLLDLVLAGFSFSHDLSETYRSELGLGPEFSAFCKEHVAFFQNVRERWEPLQELITPKHETPATLAVKMMGILTAPDGEQRRVPRDFSRILFDLVDEAAQKRSTAWELICKFKLDLSFRQELSVFIPQVPEEIQPEGALLEIVRQVWEQEQGGEVTPERRNCRVLLHEWRQTAHNENRYETIILFAQETLGVAATLANAPLEILEQMHLFPAVNSEIAHRLITLLVEEKSDEQRIRRIAAERRTSAGVRDSNSVVEAVFILLISAVDFGQELRKTPISTAPMIQLITQYLDQWYQLDRLYRRCLHAYQATGRSGDVAPVIKRIEGRYLNQFLQPLAEVWDHAIRHGEVTLPKDVLPQQRFFDHVVLPYLQRGDKVVVIISDALRYETGRELEENLDRINRVSVIHDGPRALWAVIPTVTSAGMAALLPHSELTLNEDNSVSIDARSVAGTEGRSAWLAQQVHLRVPGKRAAAFRGRDIIGLPTSAARERIEGLDVIYLYSNGIDAVADNAKTEHNLPDAVATELDLITALVRKFGNQLNRTHMVITADHGFLYQDSPVHDGHMISAEKPDGGVRDRRYLLGGMAPEDHFTTVPPPMMTLDCEVPLHVAEGLYRIRKQGGGSRYVHGGMTLQELIVPLVTIRFGRRDNVGEVSVVVMKASNSVITTPSYTVNFFQEEPVHEKNRPITLRCSFVANDNTLLSDVVEITFDSPSTDTGGRARTGEFHFSPQAVRYNGTTITLQMDKVVGGAVVPYRSEQYRYQTIGERDF
jgi:uncharacterized protein (TIGR02687 family)